MTHFNKKYRSAFVDKENNVALTVTDEASIKKKRARKPVAFLFSKSAHLPSYFSQVLLGRSDWLLFNEVSWYVFEYVFFTSQEARTMLMKNKIQE